MMMKKLGRTWVVVLALLVAVLLTSGCSEASRHAGGSSAAEFRTIALTTTTGNNNDVWYFDDSDDGAAGGGSGGGSSSEEEEDEESSTSDDETWNQLASSSHNNNNHPPKKDENAPQQQQQVSAGSAPVTADLASDDSTVKKTKSETTETMAPSGETLADNNPKLPTQQQQKQQSGPSKSLPDTSILQNESSSSHSSQSRSKGSTREEDDTPTAAGDSPPMQTLNKLQQMLDDTDYMTSNSGRGAATPKKTKQQPPPPAATTTTTTTSNKPAPTSAEPQQQQERLWTSKDRSKYKRLQNRVKAVVGEDLERKPQQQQPARQAPHPRTKEKKAPKLHNPSGRMSPAHFPAPQKQRDREPPRGGMPAAPPNKPLKSDEAPAVPHPPMLQQFSSDDEHSEEEEDGLGYTLPNLPVYYSDGEESDELSDADHPPNQNVAAQTTPPNNLSPPPPPPQQQQQQQQLPGYYGYQQQQQQQHFPHQPHQHNLFGIHQSSEYMQPPPHPPYSYATPQQQMYGYQYPYPPYMTPQQHAFFNQQYGAGWNPYLQQQQQQHAQQQQQHSPLQLAPRPSATSTSANDSKAREVTSSSSSSGHESDAENSRDSSQAEPERLAPPGPVPAAATPAPYPMDYTATPYTIFVPPESLKENNHALTFDSFQKIGLTLVTVSLACYSGVSPRSLPLSQYNLRFYENLGLVSLATIAPIVQCLLVIAPRENDMNAFINTFFTSFTLGYVWAFGSEIIATTAVRLVVFKFFEPKIFSLAPKVPIPIIPWVLRETGYRPKRITLLAAEIAASCIVCPIIEEYVKLSIMQWTTNLKRNFIWSQKKPTSSGSGKNSKNRGSKKWVAEPILRPPMEPDVVSANQFVSQMLAASLGLKLCDAGRRILLYTKRSNPSRSFYALCRGLFPIQELCGTMTALGLAKRDLLGVRMPLWKLLFPAVLIHGMANFRGKKPVYRWGSATPWSEMQLPAFHILDSSSLPQLLSKGFAKLMWLIIIARVTGYCLKNYYMVNRQAVKRTTTYAGKPAAFSAELTTTEMLKKK